MLKDYEPLTIEQLEAILKEIDLEINAAYDAFDMEEFAQLTACYEHYSDELTHLEATEYALAEEN